MKASFSSSSNSSRPLGVASKLFFSLLLLLVIALCVLITYFSCKDSLTTLAGRRFSPTPCTITRNRIIEKSPYHVDLLYTYTVAGRPYSSSLLYDGYTGSDDYHDSQTLRDLYPPKSSQTCFVDPTYPSHAILQHKTLWTLFIPLFPLSIITLCSVILYLLWRAAPFNFVNMRHPTSMMAAFFSIFFITGVIGIAAFIPTLKRGRAGQSWPAVPCRITAATVASHTSSSSTHGSTTTWSVEVLFHYRVNGKRYGSSRYALANSSNGDYANKHQTVEDLLAHRNTTCYVNPADPADAVLSKQYATAAILIGGVSTLFTLVGAIGILVLVRIGYTRHRALNHPSHESAELKQAFSPRLKVASLFAFALLWNGLVSIFVALLIAEAHAGSVQIMPIVIVSIFVLCGLALLTAALVSLRLLSFPVAHLLLNPQPLHPGETAQLQWHFPAPRDPLKTLKLRAARFESSPNEYDVSQFRQSAPSWSAPVLDISSPPPTGQCTLQIPPEALPPPSRQRTLWIILLDADVGRRSPLQQEFLFQLQPH